MKVVLAGNQNCGKTTLFNRLTGLNQHVGNFPGVTIDAKTGKIKDTNIEIVDLPGIYSLSPYSKEEIITRNYIIKEKIDAIINIVDATNIERNLYLTLQVLELEVPTIIALNMMDEVRSSGTSIDIPGLIEQLRTEIIPISAQKNEGVEELIQCLKKVVVSKNKSINLDYSNICIPFQNAVNSLIDIFENRIYEKEIPLKYAISHIIEKDNLVYQELTIGSGEKEIIERIITKLEKECQMDNETLMANIRYNFIENVVKKTVKKNKLRTREQDRTAKIDKILTNKYVAYPIFILIMGLIFYLSFGFIGYNSSVFLENIFKDVIYKINNSLIKIDCNEIIRSLLINGILIGISSVLSFIPTILTLFLFLSILEDSGYMARVAFIMDKPLRKLGLSGRSFVPLLIGFGCTVPATMASRTLVSEKDRRLTIFLIPFMSCSAKLPIYATLTAAFFGKYATLVMISLYVFGIITAIIISLIIKTLVKSKPTPFMMELPTYRLPSLKTTGLLMWEKAQDFIKKVFTIIFLATLVIWFFESFDGNLNYVVNHEKSMLAYISKWIAKFFYPLGLGNWKISASLISGIVGKEAILSTLNVLFKNIGDLSKIINPLQAYTLLVFILLSMPCLASYSAIKKELKSTWEAMAMMIFQTSIAWIMSFIVYNVGVLIC